MEEVAGRREYLSRDWQPELMRKLATNEAKRKWFLGRISHLPVRIGNEWARMLLCESEDRAMVVGTMTAHPKSSDCH
jgi:hypothetical protein